MQKFTQKYCLVAFLEPVSDGAEFHYSSWPLHVTLADVFSVPLGKDELIALLDTVAPKLKAVTVTARDDTFLGSEKQVRVTLLEKNEDIAALHLQIVKELEKADAVFNDPQFTHDGFLPHVTVQHHARIHKNDLVSIKTVSLLDMFPGGDPHQRKVLKTWNLTVMNTTDPLTHMKRAEHEKARTALAFIIPLLKKYNFRWVITGGFACYAYGVERLLTDIDIDIETSKDSDEFKSFLHDVSSYITQPLENFVNENYDNYNFELTYQGQIIDICPMKELKIFDKEINGFRDFYNQGFPPTEAVNFEGFDLPLLSKEEVIKNKEMLTDKDEWQQRDIDELRRILSKQ